ncbi:polyprenyl synthetase family protein [Desulforegula conservatrix]|uniref:polyprenyl synthetase family protein n=1 Tax=Desulforegula conservatrix TaxID=153026 RepID=UPI00040F1650|nr:polyprenyl synthetase family protein [Desulforegula conservatrix]
MTDLKRQLVSRLSPDLEKIEKALVANLDPNIELVKKIAGHLLFSGGKRLRPILMMLSARSCGYEKEDASDFSVIFEYLHAATLLHDDVVDGALVRRGNPAAHTLWDAPAVVLTGDFLLAKSLELAAMSKNPEIIRVIASITREMAQGEIDQMTRKGDFSLSEEEYMSVIKRKTAVLIEGALKTGALLSGAENGKTEALSSYGYHLGMAFQMADDLLDYTTDLETLGKNPGADLREGKMTLPVIESLKNAKYEEKEFMLSMLGSTDFSSDDFEKFISLADKHGGISYTRERAVFHVAQAKKALESFKRNTEIETLEMLADYALLRKS